MTAGDRQPSFVRNPAVNATEIDAETFLVEPDSGEVFYLDEISSALWRLVEAPCTRDEIIDAFVAAFPDVPPERIGTDIAAALDDMTGRGLVVDAG